jgi:hypothetical protein
MGRLGWGAAQNGVGCGRCWMLVDERMSETTRGMTSGARPTLLPRRSNSQPHSRAAPRSPSGLCGSLRDPSHRPDFPGHYLASAGWRDGVRLLRRWRVQRVGPSRFEAVALVTCRACSSCVASACISLHPTLSRTRRSRTLMPGPLMQICVCATCWYGSYKRRRPCRQVSSRRTRGNIKRGLGSLPAKFQRYCFECVPVFISLLSSGFSP